MNEEQVSSIHTYKHYCFTGYIRKRPMTSIELIIKKSSMFLFLLFTHSHLVTSQDIIWHQKWLIKSYWAQMVDTPITCSQSWQWISFIIHNYITIAIHWDITRDFIQQKCFVFIQFIITPFKINFITPWRLTKLELSQEPWTQQDIWGNWYWPKTSLLAHPTIRWNLFIWLL